MLSIPHLIVIFVVVLVVFGPQKLPELARGLGKLMAEFRKASLDFRTAFEEEMRDLDRQAREVELRKQELAAKGAAHGPAGAIAESGAPESASAMPAESALRAPGESVAHGSEISDSTEEKAAAVDDNLHDHEQPA